MRKLLRRLTSSSCPSCRDRVSPYAVACADCGSRIRSSRSASPARNDRALVWLLGGAVAGCVVMLAVGPLTHSA